MKVYRILMVAIMLAILTVGAVSAADNATQDTVSASDSDGDLEGIHLNEDDFYMNADENETLSNMGQELLEATDSGSAEYGNATSYDGKYYLFRGDCWTIVNNFEASAAITSESYNDLTVTGTFRTTNDLIGMYWYSKDILEHPYISYGERSDYTDVVLEFDYNMTGCKDFLNCSFTIESNAGETYYLEINRFIKNNHVTLNFNNLTLPVNSTFYRNGQAVKVSTETKIDVSDLKLILFTIIPTSYNGANYTIIENTDFRCKISNITVTNGEICDEQPQLAPHQYRICEGYDDSYNINPYRLAKEMRKLGYAEWVDLYIGASYYYEKSGIVGDVITEMGFNHNRTEMMVLNKTVPLNKAFMAWLDCYSRELKNNGVENLIISVSMENLQSPKTWRQAFTNGEFAMTTWQPSTFLFTPCNDEVVSYMQNVSESCLDIVVANGMRPILQMGETWWWWDDKPYFYDEFTQAKYRAEHDGVSMPYMTYKYYNKTAISWLNQQLVKYSDALHDVVKSSKYADGLYMVLFYLPSVIDTGTVPQMIIDVNYLKDAYTPDKLDILQIEDYDWVIWSNAQHSQAYTIGQELGFNEDKLHYFGGFVEYKDHAERLWPLIEKAMDDAIEKNFSEVYVWAGSQVRRDAKIIGYDEYAILKNIKLTGQAGIVSPIIKAPEFASNEENFTIKILTDEWINGAFKVYEYHDGAKGNLIASSDIINGSSSVMLSNTNIGLNKYYLEFNYTDGGYHLIYEVYVIENSQNITANVSAEVETGSDANITFTAPASSQAYVNISVDENAPISYLVENGKMSTTIANLSDGDHTVLVTYNNGQYVDKKLIGEVYYKTFTVKVGTKTDIETSDVNKTYNSSDVLHITLKDSNGTALEGKNVSIVLNGTEHIVETDKNGQANLTIDLLPGNYTAEIAYVGDDVYLSAHASAKVIVNKIVTELTSNDITVTYGDESILFITLTDNNGTALIGKDIIISLDGENHTVTTDNDGKANLTVDSLPGNYTAEISYAGDLVYVPSTYISNIEIDKIITNLTTSDVSFIYDEPVDLIVTLNDERGNALTGKEVLITLDGVNHTVTINNDSKANLTLDVLPGNYTAEIFYLGDNVYVESSAVANITIDKVTTNLTTADVSYIYDEPTDLIITLNDRKGNALNGTDVLIRLDGKNHTVTTDNDGKATLTIDSLPGNYTAEISYAGDKVYVESSAVSNIEIGKVVTNLTTSDISYIYDEPTDLIITLKDRKGNAMKSTNVSIALDGKKHTVTTDNDGKATLTIDSLPGNYTAEISYAGDKVYVE
ncbi:collagen binding domain-containing protein, partial [uncultured Methanobrevibacter sp.]|uniref:MSCRAMM family protein n=1 Tax=uncultured Methanobrevibacter sp. TaxID=253161 RepID=UPI002602731E